MYIKFLGSFYARGNDKEKTLVKFMEEMKKARVEFDQLEFSDTII